MGKVYAVINQKGGVGKTTTAFNLVDQMMKQGKKVLAIDVDSQGSLTRTMGFVPSELEYTVGNLFEMYIKRIPVLDMKQYILSGNGIDLLPANSMLSVADISIVTATAREYLLKKIIAPIRDQYDYIVIDCPPTLGMVVVNILTAADELIVPIKAGETDTLGFEALLDTVEMIKLETNPALHVAGVVLTMFDSRLKEARKVLEEVKSRCADVGIHMFEAKITSSTKVSAAFRARKSLEDYDANSALAQNYIAFVQEVLAHE